MAFLDSTGELTDEARAAFMEAMIEEEDSEEEDEVEYCSNNFQGHLRSFEGHLR